MTEDPFIRSLRYGNSDGKEGYWNYDHLIVQLEDCIDVMLALNGNKYDYLFLFDHSSGHDRMRDNAKNVNRMNIGFSGMQKTLRPTKITKQNYKHLIGKYWDANNPDHVKVGQTQHFKYQKNDAGPFHLSQEEREKQKWFRKTHNLEEKSLSKFELRVGILNKLKKSMNDDGKDIIVRGNLKQLQQRAEKMGIKTTKKIKKRKQGWMGQPKGMKQIAYERGFIPPDKSKWSNFTEHGNKNDNGNNKGEETSLRKILSSCYDFEKEETLLQTFARKIAFTHNIRIIVDRTPVCHPEIAGEGIEYSWAVAKIILCMIPFSERKKQKDFFMQVKAVLSAKEENKGKLTREMVRKLSARARDYMVAYYKLHQKQRWEHRSNMADDKQNEDNSAEKQNTPFIFDRLMKKDIEIMNKVYRSHRDVLTHQTGFCFAVASDGHETQGGDLLDNDETLI